MYCNNGIKVLDALHLACAVEVKAKYFCTMIVFIGGLNS